MLNGDKTIETRLFEKTELDGPAPYTHVIFRMVKKIRKTGVTDHVMAKLGGRMGPNTSMIDRRLQCSYPLSVKATRIPL